MFQTIPLRASLSIEMHFIVKCVFIERDVVVQDLMLQSSTREAWELERVKWPVELEMPAYPNLATGIHDDLWGQ